VQSSPSLHAEPSPTLGLLQTPEAGSQTPTSWHWSSAVHTTAAPVQAPAKQASSFVQKLPSLHSVPSASEGFEHVPVALSQLPATWH
jgi:hypothetical protein